MTLLDFTSARWDGTTRELCLKPINVPAVLQWLVKHDEKKTYTCEIKEFRKREARAPTTIAGFCAKNWQRPFG